MTSDLHFVALDLGEHLGYAMFIGLDLVDCGTLRLPASRTKAHSLLARRYREIKLFLISLADRCDGLNEVLYEQTDWFLSAHRGDGPSAARIREHRNRVVQRALGRLEGLVESAAGELGLTCTAVALRDAKSALTGKPGANKDVVARHVAALFPGLEGVGQDARDSLAVAAWRLARLDSHWRQRVRVAPSALRS